MKHLFGLIITIALLALFYFGWNDWLPQGRQFFRGLPFWRSVYNEFSLLIGAALAFLILTLVQLLWDRFPSGGK
ncbi:MAG: hypothetical protein AAF468_03005 [Pseudomonadota bacterium]